MHLTQCELNTSDMAGSMQLYSEAFGFHNAGGQINWGPPMQVQGLGPDARAVIWWLVGQQPAFQLEFFQHSIPEQRPLPAEWRPCDIGWVRLGIVVADFDAALEILGRRGIQPLAPGVVRDGKRRIAIRDPYVGVIVEIIESDPQHPEGPAIAYITSSVSDIVSARDFYAKHLGAVLEPLEQLHLPSDEALWGLPGAEREGFVAKFGFSMLEVVQYRNPVGRPKPADNRISDQGIQNVAFGGRDVEEIAKIFENLQKDGVVSPFVFQGAGSICGYINDPEREFEFAFIPQELEQVLGLVPATSDFLGRWS